MNDSEYVQVFWENGFVMIEDFFEYELMDHLNDLILMHFGKNPNWEHSEYFIQKSATEVIPWFPLREGNPNFLPIEEDKRFKNLTQNILGNDWESLYLMVMFSKKGTSGQAWHQDCPPEDPNRFNLNRLFYTHDINEQTGGQIIIYPGSHKMGEIPAGKPNEDIENQVVLNPKKGTLIIVHGHCWHRVRPIKGEYRISANARSIPKGTPEDITDIAVYRNMRYRFSTQEVLEER